MKSASQKECCQRQDGGEPFSSSQEIECCGEEGRGSDDPRGCGARKVSAGDDSRRIGESGPEHRLARGLELEFVWRGWAFRRRKFWKRGHAWA